MFVASDVAALVRYTQQVVHLDDGELATVHAAGFRTFDRRRDRAPTTSQDAHHVDGDAGDYERGEHEHFMRKEILEQPDAAAPGPARPARRALRHRRASAASTWTRASSRSIRRVKILGCGSAYYAGQIGAQLIEELARIPADAEPACEFRYRNPVVEPDTLYVAVSQSGETIDTLAGRAGAPAQGRPGASAWSTSSARDRPRVRRTASTCTPARRSRSPPPRR